MSGGWGVKYEVALPQDALLRGPWNYPSGTWGRLMWAQDPSFGHAVKGVENLVRQDEALLTWLILPRSDVA